MDDEGVVGGTALCGENALSGVGVEGEGGEAIHSFGRKCDGLEGTQMARRSAEGGEGVRGGTAGTAVEVELDRGGITLQHLGQHHSTTTDTGQHGSYTAGMFSPTLRAVASILSSAVRSTSGLYLSSSPCSHVSVARSSPASPRTLYSLCERIKVTMFSAS